MAIAYRRTATEIAQDVSRAVGVPPNVNPFASTNPSQSLIVWAMNRAGLELAGYSGWQELTKNATISVVADFAGQTEKSYSLPTDFRSFVDQSQWDTQNLTPAVGPLSSQDVQLTKTWTIASALGLTWQVRGDKIIFVNPPPTARVFDYFYNSNAWAEDADLPGTYKSTVSKNGDKPLFDATMFETLASIKWLNRKGLDSTDLQGAFTLQRNSQRDGGAPILRMAKGGLAGVEYGRFGVPQTGYGS